MIYDFQDNNTPTEIIADICIIGGGAAGITLARELTKTGKRICLIESGGHEIEPDTQRLYQLEEIGVRSALAASRLRYFGGTTNHWEGYCGPLDKMDFEERSWVPDSGWPITRSDMDKFYEKAHNVCELGPYAYDVDTLALANRIYPEYDPKKLFTHLWQRSGPTRFGPRYLEELSVAQNVAIYLNANLLELEVNDSASRVRSASISTVTKKTGRVQADEFVLACGGIENTRMLLASNSVQNRGLGNQSDMVGRYWMQHPWIESAIVAPTDPERYQAELTTHLFSEYTLKDIEATVLPGVSPTEAAQIREQILNLIVTIRGGHSTDTGFHQLKRIGGKLKRGEWPREFGDKIYDVLTDLGSVTDGIGMRLSGETYAGPFLDPTVYSQIEQAPNPDSRITLSEVTDALGIPIPKVDWRLGELEKHTLKTTMRIMGEEFARLGLGRMKITDWILEEGSELPQIVAGGGHHIGGTRMSNDPAKGVVDSDCRVHSIDNLYIGGSSVFPTGGCINPTLTIVALAIRLAEHLQDKVTTA